MRKNDLISSKVNQYLQDIKGVFIPPREYWLDIARGFASEITRTLAGNITSLPIVAYDLNLPTGNETGLFCVLDIGGTSARALLIELQGRGRFQILSHVSKTFRDPQGPDYVSSRSSEEALFDFQARLIAETLQGYDDQIIKLGYTFSFPSYQNNLNHCRLIRWAKEINTPDVEGKDVVVLLQQAIKRNDLAKRVLLRATINDTIATLLASAYSDPHTDIGSIIATGQNTCCVQQLKNGEQRIVNLECGNYTGVSVSKWDAIVDRISRRPGEQLYEKMVSGQYIGELVRIICLDLAEQGLLFSDVNTVCLQTKYSLEARHLASILTDNTSDHSNVAEVLYAACNINDLTLEERQVVQSISSLVVVRSAYMIAASYAGILMYMDPDLSGHHTIAIDGSVYEKMPGFASTLKQVLDEIFGIDLNRVSLRLIKDGSSIGTAVAVAMTSGPS